MKESSPHLSPFGILLRRWRSALGLSQLELAAAVGTTPRYVSFIETGRSRPGRELVLRMGERLRLSLRARNELLAAAGWPPAFPARELDAAEMKPFQDAIERILRKHEPYPASALDPSGVVQMANDAFRRLLPGVEALSAEESIDQLFGDAGRAFLVNWAEVAWANADLRCAIAERTGDPKLVGLADRAMGFLKGVPRPERSGAEFGLPAACARVRSGETEISTFTSVLRFETAEEVGMNELRVELIFPADATAERLFRGEA